MAENLFSILSKYKSLEIITPEENYSTELFVYLLNYSLRQDTPLFQNFMDLLGETIRKENYSEFSVLTQRPFFTKSNLKAYPDITIESKDQYYFIEVKVESGLNYYSIDNVDNLKEIINQIQKYQNVVTSEGKKIYLLTKYVCETSFEDCPDFKRKIRWHEIYNLLKKYLTNTIDEIERFLINETIKYLEEKDMSIPKVSYELMSGVESLNNLIRQLEIVLEGIPNSKSFGRVWLGYNLFDEKKNSIGWVGTYYDGTKLSFQYYKQTLKAIKEQNSDAFVPHPTDKKQHFVYFDFEREHYFCLSAEEQLDKLKKWVSDNYKRLLEYSKKQ